MRAPSLLSVILTVSPAIRRVECKGLSKLLSSLVEGIRTGNGRRAVGRTVGRCVATGPPCLRIAYSRSTWLKLPRPVLRPWRMSEVRSVQPQLEEEAKQQALTTPSQMAMDSKVHQRPREEKTIIRARAAISSRGINNYRHRRKIRDRAVAAPTTKILKHTREKSIDRGSSSSSKSSVADLWEANQQVCLQTLRLLLIAMQAGSMPANMKMKASKHLATLI